MKRILICAASIEPREWSWFEKKFAREEDAADLVIGVDRGMGHLRRLGVTPEIAIGDWDSFPLQKVPSDCVRVDLPQSKNYSDFSLALAFAISLQPEEIIVFGICGGRKDHEILALEDVRALIFGKTIVRVVCRDFSGMLMEVSQRPVKVRVSKSRFSLLAPLGVNLKLSGAKYILRGKALEIPSHGLGNKVQDKEIQLSVVGAKSAVIALLF